MDLLKGRTGDTHGTGAGRRFALLAALMAVLALCLPTAALASETTIEAESMALQDSGVHVFSDASASGGKALNFTSNDTATTTVSTGSASTLTLTARGDQCQGAPEAVLTIDGATVFTVQVPATAWTQYSTTVGIAAGTHTIVLAYDNDLYVSGVCDRNLRVDKLTLSGSSTSQPPAAPTGLVATPGNAQVALAWNANTDAGLAGYDVYRASTSGGPYTNLTATPVTSPAYTDTGVVNGTTYYYVVKAINTASQLSGASNQVSAKPTAPSGESTTKIEAESMTLPDSDVHVFSDPSASGGKALNFTGNDTATTTLTTGAIGKLILAARGDQCQGAPEAVVSIDGIAVFTVQIPATSWTQYTTPMNIAAGKHTVVVTYDNDFSVSGVCDRNLRADYLTLSYTSGTATPLLPDIVQRPPSQVGVVQVEGTYRLGFQSSMENVGAGPLIIHGHRASTSAGMVADQVLDMSDGSTTTRAGIGSMIFYVPHNHWHYLGFDHYELRKASDYSLVAPDQKMGFCLGDRFSVKNGIVSSPPEPPGPFSSENCESGNPGALSVTEGITPGYGDLYGPQVEGQYIDVTGVPAGEYEIVHRVNEDHSVDESNYNDNNASVLVKLWPNGYGASPGVQVLQTCAGSEHCPPQGATGTTTTTTTSTLASSPSASASPSPSPSVSPTPATAAAPAPAARQTAPVPLVLVDPPLLVPRSARYFAAQALQRVLGGPLRELGVGCKRISNVRYSCAVTLRVHSVRYTGKVTVWLSPKGAGQPGWNYSMRLVRHGTRGDSRVTSAHSSALVRASARVVVKATLEPLLGARGLVLWCVPPTPAPKH
jgi:hypothetical protein